MAAVEAYCFMNVDPQNVEAWWESKEHHDSEYYQVKGMKLFYESMQAHARLAWLRNKRVWVNGKAQIARELESKLSGEQLWKFLEHWDDRLMKLELLHKSKLPKPSFTAEKVARNEFGIASHAEKGRLYHLAFQTGDRCKALAPVKMHIDIRDFYDGNEYQLTVIEPNERKVPSLQFWF